MAYIFMAVFAILIVSIDQLTKYWTVHNIVPGYVENYEIYFQKLCESYSINPDMYDQLNSKITVIPDVLQFSHIFNDGGAWGMFDGAIWLFVIVFSIFAAFINFL